MPACAKPRSGTVLAASLLPPFINATNASTGVPVAVSALAIDSVEGQRARPSEVMRFDLLNVVGSSPARRASPEADRPARSARRSIADQICAWVSIESPQSRRPDDRNDCLIAQVLSQVEPRRAWSGKRSCSNKTLERDDVSKRSHPALGAYQQPKPRS